MNIGEMPFPEPPRLLDDLHRAVRVRHYLPRTEKAYTQYLH